MIGAPRDFASGILLIVVALIALWQGANLPSGTLNQIGSGFLPRVLAIAVALCGFALVIRAFFRRGLPLERWSIRGPALILGAAVVFGLAIRPLGLAVAGLLLIVISAFASSETRWRETLVFGAVITVFCVLLFKIALSLPIPLAPWLIGY